MDIISFQDLGNIMSYRQRYQCSNDQVNYIIINLIKVYHFYIVVMFETDVWTSL